MGIHWNHQADNKQATSSLFYGRITFLAAKDSTRISLEPVIDSYHNERRLCRSRPLMALRCIVKRVKARQSFVVQTHRRSILVAKYRVDLFGPARKRRVDRWRSYRKFIC